jgi:hypothetical protein
MDLLIRIKRAVLSGHIIFTTKATEEGRSDGLTEDDIREAILSASAIYKSIRSTSQRRSRAREMLHVIYGTTFTGIVVYTKGKLIVVNGIETYYVCISAKRSE